MYGGYYWNKHLTKAVLVGIPLGIAAVIVKSIFDWLAIAVIVWAAWVFLQQRFQKR
jgi:hypothetical protein